MERKNEILQELTENAPHLAPISSLMPYRVPEGYFETLADVVLRRIRAMDADSAAGELATLSPLLAGLTRETPYKTPAGYFEQLAVLNLPDTKKETPVRSMAFPRRVLRYAAAAVVAGIIGITAFYIFTPSRSTDNTVAVTTTDTAPQQDILQEVATLSDDEMMRYIDGNITPSNFEAVNANDEIQEEDMRLILAELSDKELEHYLN